MNISSNKPQLNNSYQVRTAQSLNNSKDIKFKGWGNSALKFLADEPVWGATIIDIAAMVLPRTWTDMKKRGYSAGFETGFRESESSANDAAVGLYGVAAGALIAKGLNKQYGVSAHKIFASTDATDVLSTKWVKHKGNVDEYVKDIADNIEGYNPTSPKANDKGFVRIPEEHKQAIIDDLKYIAEGPIKGMDQRWKEVHKRLNAKIVDATGAEREIRLVHKHGAFNRATVSTSKTLLDNYFNLTKAFKSDKVQGKLGGFISKFKKFGNARTGIGIAIAAVFAVGAQPLNVYLSKKRTGTDGFVGVEGRKKDNSFGFQLTKVASAIGMCGIALASMGALSKHVKKIPKLFMEKNQYKGTNPTINQFKTVFGLAIASRLLTSRDKDEHREVITKDVLGYFNWLMIGNVVNQLILKKLQPKCAPSLLKMPVRAENTSKFYSKLPRWGQKTLDLVSSSIATHTEILVEGLKKERPDIKSLIKPDGKAMKFSEMLKELPKGSETRKALRFLNIAQIAGYVYSGVVLGIGIPNLNIAITNHLDKKHKAAKVKMAEQSIQHKNNYTDKLVFRSSNVFNKFKEQAKTQG